MSEPPAKPKSVFGRMRSWSLRTWVVVLVVESFVFLALLVLFVWAVFR